MRASSSRAEASSVRHPSTSHAWRARSSNWPMPRVPLDSGGRRDRRPARERPERNRRRSGNGPGPEAHRSAGPAAGSPATAVQSVDEFDQSVLCREASHRRGIEGQRQGFQNVHQARVAAQPLCSSFDSADARAGDPHPPRQEPRAPRDAARDRASVVEHRPRVKSARTPRLRRGSRSKIHARRGCRPLRWPRRAERSFINSCLIRSFDRIAQGRPARSTAAASSFGSGFRRHIPHGSGRSADAQVILANAGMRVTDEADAAGGEIGNAVGIIVKAARRASSERALMVKSRRRASRRNPARNARPRDVRPFRHPRARS